MFDDELHQLACDYASSKKEAFDKAVAEALEPPPPYIQKLYQWLWVAHYEGFKNGYAAALKEKNHG